MSISDRGRLWLLGSVLSLALGGASQVLAEGFEGVPFRIKEVEVEFQGTELALMLVVPYPMKRNLPAVVFLPGLMADVDQYQSYAEDLAAKGILVAIHPWYSLLMPDVELAQNAKRIADWLIATLRVDPSRIGIAGHSMGAKDAILAQGLYGGFEAIVAIDPDDTGEVSAIQPYTRTLSIPLLLIGAELGWDAPDFCAPMDKNYQRFFEQSPPGTLEMTLIGADHVLMLDDPERLGYNLCRSGWADPASVHAEALAAVGLFFEEHLKVRRNPVPRLPGKAIRVRGEKGPEPLAPAALRGAPEGLPSEHSEDSVNQPGSAATGSDIPSVQDPASGFGAAAE